MPVAILNRQRKYRVATAELRDVAERILEALGCAEAELTVTLVSDRRMRALNRDYRDQDEPTDVLSFPQEGDDAPPSAPGAPKLLGDVVLAVETALRQAAPNAAEPGRALFKELCFLMLHGVLHLVGHRHDGEADARAMRAEHDRIAALLPTWE